MISTGMGLGFTAQAHAETRLQVTSARQTDDAGKSQLVYTAHVADISGNTASNGTVSFDTAAGSIGSAVVDSSGDATIKVDSLPAKTTSITAVYYDATGSAVSSQALAVTSDATTTTADFSVTANPSSLTITAGDYSTATITVTPENGYNQPTTLSCSGLPNAATCTFNPTVVTPTTTASVTSTLQIQTQAVSGNTSSSKLEKPNSGRMAWAFAGPGLLALAGLGALRRRNAAFFRMMGVFALLAAGSIGMSSCSTRYAYLNKGPSNTPGTTAGTYTVVISAYGNNGSSVTSHTLNLALTVK